MPNNAVQSSLFSDDLTVQPSEPALRGRTTSDELGHGPDENVELMRQIDAEFARGLGRLRFNSDIEARFDADTFKAKAKAMRIAAAGAGLASNVFLIFDHLMVPDVFGLAVALRLAVFTPLIFMVPMLIRMFPTMQAIERGGMVATIATAAVHAYIVCGSQSAFALPYLVGLAIVIMHSNAFLRLRFRRSLVTTLVISAGAGLAYALMPETSQSVAGVPVLLMIWSSAAFTLFALYHLERDERHNFLMSLRQRLLRVDLKRTIGELEGIARIDTLTQVPNRRHFDNHLERVWRRAQTDGAPVSVLMIDIDHFRQYNEVHGQRGGDACLRAVAGALESCLRRPTDLVARYGGDEFVAVLNHNSSEQAIVAAQRVQDAVQALAWTGPAQAFKVTVSIGVASLESVSRYDSSASLVAMADHALRSARRGGGDRVFVQWTEGVAR